MTTSAFAGHELTMEAYQEAIKEKYRFFAYGDAAGALNRTLGRRRSFCLFEFIPIMKHLFFSLLACVALAANPTFAQELAIGESAPMTAAPLLPPMGRNSP